VSTKTRLHVLLVLLICLLTAVLLRPHFEDVLTPVIQRIKGNKTTKDRLAEFGAKARERMELAFQEAGVSYPPGAVALVGIKSTRTLQVYAGASIGALIHVADYPVQGQSGTLGPKLREGDRQVPEGLYRIEGFNPNSTFYVSMRVNYPNEWDREHAEAEGRKNLGGDIYIHGQSASIGCLAMGDPAIEELFTLVADVGAENTRVIIAPVDLGESNGDFVVPDEPSWLPSLYAEIEAALQAL
jgi:murein L,D-transpeptidase YafK